jgi:endogenous inhibitor of DNA gyrase (YacG/DUF329 family)
VLRCPTCGKLFDPDRSDAAPFCSDRCRTVDLGRWLDERHGLPVEPEEERDEPEKPLPDSDASQGSE